MPEDAGLAAAKAALLAELGVGSSPAASTKRPRKRRRRGRTRPPLPPAELSAEQSSAKENASAVEYVPETVEHIVEMAKATVPKEQLGEFEDVLRRFAEREGGVGVLEEEGGEKEEGRERELVAEGSGEVEANGEVDGEGDREEDDSSGEGHDVEEGAGGKEGDMSRKQRKEHQRNLISRLKSLSEAPEVVEAWDITGPDPLLLVHLKSLPNSVPVPANWRQKRKYLQNKRGMEKRAFQLPAYIVDTGVGELRDAQLEADEKKTLKQRQREKMRAKTGRGVEIDHARLHDAFFKFQTKPRLTGHGDVYYELRELEVDHSKFRPGVLSEELRAALGVSEGDPPPWLVNLQRYGPPPGYPGLTVPGLNCPIPAGASFGYQPGGWGKPPVDENGRPLYGDVFDEGLQFGHKDERFDLSDREKARLWGEVQKVGDGLRVVAEAEEKAVGSADEEERDDAKEKRAEQSAGKGRPSAPETVPTENEVRKGVPEGQLFAVLEERAVSVGEKGMMGSSHVYRVEGGSTGEEKRDAAGGAGEKRKREEAADARRVQKKQKEFKF